LQIVMMPTARLVPYARNARTHSDEQVAQIAAAITEFGWTNPILIGDDDVIIAGHGRLMAAQRLGMAEVPVIVLGHLNEAQRRAVVVSDNKIALNAGWDLEILMEQIELIRSDGFELDLIGFSDDELAEIMDGLEEDADDGGAVDGEDEVPEAPVEPVSRLGDLWVLDGHRLLCGDSTVATDVDRVMGGVRPMLMVTDPPYGVEYDPSWRNKALGQATSRTGKVLNDDKADWRETWSLFPGDVAYIWHGALHATTVADSLIASGFNVRSQIIWAKDRLILSRGDYHWQHEPCWYAVRKGGKGHWAGDRKQTTLWHIANKDQDAQTVHGTQKPVECMRRPILNNSSPGQAVYEPFMGSGTTLIAAETTGRVCLGIELNPAYVDVGVERWQNLTGKEATLDGDGRTFAEVMDERKNGIAPAEDAPSAAPAPAKRKRKPAAA